MDPHTVLNVPRNADMEQIRSAYKKLALLCHPDKNNNSSTSKEKFQEIRAAFETLSSRTSVVNTSAAEAKTSQRSPYMGPKAFPRANWQEFMRSEHEAEMAARTKCWKVELDREFRAWMEQEDERRKQEREAFVNKTRDQQNGEKLEKHEMAERAEKEKEQRKKEMEAQKKEKLERELKLRKFQEKQRRQNLREQGQREDEELKQELDMKKNLRLQAENLALNKKRQHRQQENKTVEDIQAEIKGKVNRMRQNEEQSKSADMQKSDSGSSEKGLKRKLL